MGFPSHQRALLKNVIPGLLCRLQSGSSVNRHNYRTFLNFSKDFLFHETLFFLVFMRLFLYNKDMDIKDFEPIFTNEQLHKMSKENLAKVILLMQKQQTAMQKQQSTLEEKVSDLQKKQQLLEEKNKELAFINALRSDRLSIAQRKRFGSSSEKYPDGYEQMNLFNEAEEAAAPDAVEPVMEEICPKPYKRKKQKGKKKQDLSAYPVTETIHYTLEGENGFCPECKTPMKEVTTEITKNLKFVPAHFEVQEEVVHVYSCPKCSAMERAWGSYHPKEFLEGYSGYLTTDGYQSYHGLPEEIRVTGCMVHSWKRFEECLTILKKQVTKEQLKQTTAYKAMERIAMLYK